MPPPEIRIIGIQGLPEIRPGDDLAKMLVDAAKRQKTPLQTGDILVITQKVVSKAEGRLVKLADVKPSGFAKSIAATYQKDPRQMELILRESKRIVRMDMGILITETKHGFICANGGIDTSNLEVSGYAALLPEDSDKSARGIKRNLKRLNKADVAIIISDTFGRPWREGCTNVAIGVAGILPLIDYRGQKDPAGYLMRASILAVADELASATEPIMGKLNRIPAAIVRGFDYPKGNGSSRSLVRDAKMDMFR